MVWRGKQASIMADTETREIDIEGAIRAGKTTVCLWKEHEFARKYPGIAIILARWTEDAAHGLIRPLWNSICNQAGDKQSWNSMESCYDWPNGSRIYVLGLKSQDVTLRYSKFRGKTVARVYVDQAEELPRDVYLELAGRLSQPGYPHQITISPQAIEDTHWIAQEFPSNNPNSGRMYYPLSIYDNAHNLDASVIPALERLYPPSHPKHRTLIQGVRGMNVTGDPVYKGAFVRAIHEAPASYDPKLPLEMALDFGKHHPCVVFRQVSALGQVRFLGGILGQQLYLSDFLDLVIRYRSQWFPDPCEIRECCDPAGAADTSHGTHGAIKTLREHGINPKWQGDSNSPSVRLTMIERMAAQMRKRMADRQEGFVVAKNDQWLRISEQSTMIDRFLADGFEAGYVWDEHMVSVNNKQVRKPKKDGWYEHGMNCLSPDTPVWTNHGPVPIQSLVGTSGRVVSRDGSMLEYQDVRLTRRDAELVRVGFSDGSTVDCTPDHRFWTVQGWVQASELVGVPCYHGVCQAIANGNIPVWTSNPTEASGITGARVDTSSVTANGYTASSGWTRMGRSLRGCTSTTSTVIARTTASIISKCLDGLSICGSMLRRVYQNPSAEQRLMRVVRGIRRRTALSGTGSITDATWWRSGINRPFDAATSAESPTLAGMQSIEADHSAGQRADRRSAGPAASTMKHGSAPGAALSFDVSDITRRNAAAGCVLVTCVSVTAHGRSDVYCMDVPDAGMFAVGSGVLVHNCSEYLEVNFGSAFLPRKQRDVEQHSRMPQGKESWMV